jgi:hypothetical protein
VIAREVRVAIIPRAACRADFAEELKLFQSFQALFQDFRMMSSEGSPAGPAA